MPLGVVTVMSTVPADSAGATAKIVPPLTTVKLAAGTLPKYTAIVPVNPEPVIVTTEPPAVGLGLELMPVTDGADDAEYVK